MMNSAQVVKTSFIVTTNSPSQDYTHPDNHTLPTYNMTPGFKLFTVLHLNELGRNAGPVYVDRMPSICNILDNSNINIYQTHPFLDLTFNKFLNFPGYLKIYQLSRPILSGFDCLLIDEAQDCTPGKIKSPSTSTFKLTNCT